MHETMLAKHLLEAICEQAGRYEGRLVGAKISCGGLAGVNDEILRFAFETLSQGTVCQGLRLEIEHKPIRALCRGCGRVFSVELESPRCSYCDGGDFEVQRDDPLLLEEIELETD